MTQQSTTSAVPEHEFVISQIRAQGPGGQNVNKVASAVQLRFDIGNSSLPDQLKKRLLSRRDSRITKDGVLVITAQNHRSYVHNREEAIERLNRLIHNARITRKKRKATKPGKRAQQRRLDKKTHRGQLKKLRRKVE